MAIDGMRHSAIHNPERYADKRVAIVGVGTIGSHLALTLARMQVHFTMYDPDTVEAHNLATQAYSRRDIGRYKVDAIARMCEDIGAEPNNAQPAPCKFQGDEIGYDDYAIIISCVDSLDARREIARDIIAHQCAAVIIDGRVGGEQVEAYRYASAEEWLAGLPDQADTDPCGARFTAYTANICAGLLANNVKRELLGQSVPPRILYDAASSTFITPKIA
jgi:molybdopterin/thiamine biosynthesis adenylyltransferase